MNKEEQEKLLKEAREKYPPGTKFKSAFSGNEFTFKGSIFFDKHVRSSQMTQPILYNTETNEWAEIIELPKDYIVPSENLLSKLEIW